MASGKTTKLMVMGNWCMPMEMFMRDSGKMIRHMARDITSMLMGLHILVTGKMINNMELEQKHGPMELGMRVPILKEKSMVMESYNLQMDPFMRENFNLMKYLAKANMFGLIRRPLKVNGKRTKCTDMVY